MQFLTYKYRVKDATSGKHLARHARACNQVWNYCCQIQREAQSRWRAGRAVSWPTRFDLSKLTTGSSAELGLHSDTISEVCRQFVVSRDAHKRCPRFRSSYGRQVSLGWVPFVSRALSIRDAHCVYLKRKFHFWKSREIDGQFKSGSFVADARGRWYVTLQCAVDVAVRRGGAAVGIDLGLKTLVTTSDGNVVVNMRHFRRHETALAVAQRAGNKHRVRAIHATIANARRHHLHVASADIVKNYAFIVIGNVSAAKLAKTRMAKSVLDAGWTDFRHMLSYKAQKGGAVCIEADERMTSQVCSCCRVNPDSSPKGLGMLGVRHWTCSNCGASHDRDVNAAKNILRVGQERLALAGEIFARRGEDVNGPSPPKTFP